MSSTQIDLDVFLRVTNSTGLALNAAWADQVRVNQDAAYKPPAVIVSTTSYLTTNVPQNAWTSPDFQVEYIDTDHMHSVTTDPERVTFTQAGSYLVDAYTLWDASTAGTRGLRVLRNGVTVLAQRHIDTLGGSLPTRVSVDCTVEVSTGEFIEAQSWQNGTTSNRTVETTLTAVRISGSTN